MYKDSKVEVSLENRFLLYHLILCAIGKKPLNKETVGESRLEMNYFISPYAVKTNDTMANLVSSINVLILELPDFYRGRQPLYKN